MSATFSNQIEVLKNGIEFLPVLRVVAKSGEADAPATKPFSYTFAEIAKLRPEPCMEGIDWLRANWPADVERWTIAAALAANCEISHALWLIAYSGEAGLRIVRTFAIDCAERALPAYEAEYPGDLRVRAAIEVSRRYLRGEATIDEVKTAANAADAAAYAARAANVAYAAYAANVAYAAYAAAAAAYAAARAAVYAANNAGDNAGCAANAAASAAANYAAERRWQRAHLIKLLEAAK